MISTFINAKYLFRLKHSNEFLRCFFHVMLVIFLQKTQVRSWRRDAQRPQNWQVPRVWVLADVLTVILSNSLSLCLISLINKITCGQGLDSKLLKLFPCVRGCSSSQWYRNLCNYLLSGFFAEGGMSIPHISDWADPCGTSQPSA